MNVSSNIGRVNKQARLAGSQYVHGSRADSLRDFLRLGALLGLLLLLNACSTSNTTVLLASFNSDAVDSQPMATQNTGTVALDPGAGTVTVVAAPAQGLPANKWVRISHPTTPSQQTAMTGNFSHFGGAGNYGLLASLYIPSGAGAVTVQFEPFGQGPTSYLNFMHLDFMPEGDVRIDDDESLRFGHFPRDQAFMLSVNLVITATTATAHITLLGSGASGSLDTNVNPSLLSVARQFGAVKFWMGFQWQGSFFVDDILVSRNTS